jgi:hypothetical protein
MTRAILNDIYKDVETFQKNEEPLSVVVYSRAVALYTTPETATDTLQNLTGFTAKLRVKATEESTTSLFEVTGTITTPANGTITFNISSANNSIAAGVYFYEIIVYKALNDDYATINKGRYILRRSLFYT